MKISFFIRFFIMLMSLALTACASSTGLYDTTLHNVNDVQAQIASAKLNNTVAAQHFTNPSQYTDLSSSSWGSQPAWLQQHVNVHGVNVSLDFLTSRIIGNTNAAVAYDVDTNKNILVTLNYVGTIRGALDKLAALTNYSYSINGNTILWATFVTKTFDISFMPGSSQYLMGEQANVGGNPTAGSNSTVVTTQTTDSQYSNLQGTLSVWSDLQNTIKDMLSPDGKVIVSQATTTVTVRDHAESVHVIGDYLASMNKDLSRQVALQVQVLQITLKDAFSYGVNWNMVAGAFQIQGGSANALGNDLSPVGGFPSTGTSVGVGIINNPDGSSGTKVLLQALQQQGDVSVVTEPRVVTLNNQVARIAITTQKTYLASVSTTVTGAASTSQTSLTPGTVTTGFTLYVLPKIIGNEVLLQLTSELSNLDSLDKFSGSTENGSDSGDVIFAPTVSAKSFNQRSMVPSSATLVLAGFRQVNNEANKAFWGLLPLGGKGAQKINTETIVLITPIIVGNNL